MLEINVTMYIKACIYNNVTLHIQVQIDKVALEVAHLQELLAHWGNTPIWLLVFRQIWPPTTVSLLAIIIEDVVVLLATHTHLTLSHATLPVVVLLIGAALV